MISESVLAQDMAAHSTCDFAGGKAEKLALAKYRQVIWQGRVLKSQFTDEELRGQGRCPLTPEEIGLLLAALGFNNSTRLYLASHKVCHILSVVLLFPCLGIENQDFYGLLLNSWSPFCWSSGRTKSTFKLEVF